jgi:hypothetical protein
MNALIIIKFHVFEAKIDSLHQALMSCKGEISCDKAYTSDSVLNSMTMNRRPPCPSGSATIQPAMQNLTVLDPS